MISPRSSSSPELTWGELSAVAFVLLLWLGGQAF